MGSSINDFFKALMLPVDTMIEGFKRVAVVKYVFESLQCQSYQQYFAFTLFFHFSNERRKTKAFPIEEFSKAARLTIHTMIGKFYAEFTEFCECDYRN